MALFYEPVEKIIFTRLSIHTLRTPLSPHSTAWRASLNALHKPNRNRLNGLVSTRLASAGYDGAQTPGYGIVQTLHARTVPHQLQPLFLCYSLQLLLSWLPLLQHPHTHRIFEDSPKVLYWANIRAKRWPGEDLDTLRRKELLHAATGVARSVVLHFWHITVTPTSPLYNLFIEMPPPTLGECKTEQHLLERETPVPPQHWKEMFREHCGVVGGVHGVTSHEAGAVPDTAGGPELTGGGVRRDHLSLPHSVFAPPAASSIGHADAAFIGKKHLQFSPSNNANDECLPIKQRQ